MRLLRAFPPAWRSRYGEEFAALLEELDAGARLSWRERLDVVRAGLGERRRALGLRGLPPAERAREGSLFVLYGWMAFVIAGFGVQKASEHWQVVTPAAKQGLPSAAFAVLVVTAALGSLIVVLGIAAALPALFALLRRGGWERVKRPIMAAAALSLLALAATIALASWAHSLTPFERNGGDPSYSAVFIGWVILAAVCLLAWARAAAAAARQLEWSPRTLRLEVWLGVAAGAAMTVMTAATAFWWATVAIDAPWFFAGRLPGSDGSVTPLNIVLPALLMLCATAVALTGAARAVRALSQAPHTS